MQRQHLLILVLFAITVAVFTSGCSSQATFEGVKAEVVCNFLNSDIKVGEDIKPGQAKVAEYDVFMTNYKTWLKVSVKGNRRVTVQARCTSDDGLIVRREKRRIERERVLLGQLIERVLRETQGRLVECTVAGLDNIQPVLVQAGKNHADVILQGAKPETLLAVLREGLGEIAAINNRRLGNVEEVKDGFEFVFQPQNTMAFSPIRFVVVIQKVQMSSLIFVV